MQLYTTGEFAKLIGTNHRTIYVACRDNRIIATKQTILGCTRYIIQESEVEKYRKHFSPKTRKNKKQKVEVTQ